MASLTGKVVLVTGASAGIGRATAVLCAAEGARVIAVARRAEQGMETIKVIENAGGQGHFIALDISSESAVDRVFALIQQQYGRLDGAVNNAAQQPGAMEIADTPVDAFDRSMSVNLRGTFMCLRHELRMMRAQRSGAVVNVSSTAGVMGITGQGTYAAAKHALIGLTKCAAIDMAPHKVRVNCIAPGVVRTEMFDQWAAAAPDALESMLRSNPMHRAADPQEIAASIVYLLSDASSYMTGHTMLVDGGTTSGAFNS